VAGILIFRALGIAQSLHSEMVAGGPPAPRGRLACVKGNISTYAFGEPMTVTTLSSREFNQHTSRAKKLRKTGHFSLPTAAALLTSC
jgi:hypothetical protein